MGLPSNKTMIETARAQYQREGEIEIDDQIGTRMVSRSDNNEDKGAYVQAWVWVYDSDARKQAKAAA